ncbi:MAG TPA: RodZ domain-containing protein [Alphaproteobacteria bacterium]
MLRDVRASRGLSLRDAAASLRIRLAYLEAIEAGRFKDLPGATYASGFLRAYAAYLGLDGDDVMGRFKEALEGIKRPTNLTLPSPGESGHMPTGSVFLVAAIIAIAAYGGWYYMSVEGRDPSEFFAAVPQRIASLLSRSDSASTPTAPDTATNSTVIARAPEPAPAVQPEPSQTLPSTESTPPSPATTIPERPATSPAAPQPPVAALTPAPPPAVPPAPPMTAIPPAPPSEAATAAAPSTPAQPRGRIVLRATADSWVELRAPGETPILSRVLKRGETYDVPVRDDLVLATGNAGGLEIAVDGKTLPQLGAFGAVQRGIALNADRLATVNR